MALEIGTYIVDLVETNPPSTDFKSQGDDHLRLIKSVLKNTFPAMDAAVTAAPAGLNRLDSEGITLESAVAVAPIAGSATLFHDGAGQVLKIGGDAPYNSSQIVGCPVGVIMAFLGAAASLPSGWFFCSGATLNRETYANLFAVIGTTWGVGDGSTTFNLPDLSGSFPVGLALMPGTPPGTFDDGYLSSDVNGGQLSQTRINWIIKY